MNRGYQMHLGQVAEIVNTTAATLTNGTVGDPVIVPLVTPSPSSAEGYANPVKLGYALSVTFVVGCLQVRHFYFDLSLVVRKPVFRVSDQVPLKPGCTATEDS